MPPYGEVLNLKPHDLIGHYEKWGPSARTCVRLSRNIEKEDVYNAVVTRDASHFIEYPDPHMTCNPKRVPHRIFSLIPINKTENGIMMAKFASSHIQRIVLYSAATFEAERRIRFFQTISMQPNRTDVCTNCGHAIREICYFVVDRWIRPSRLYPSTWLVRRPHPPNSSMRERTNRFFWKHDLFDGQKKSDSHE